MSASVPAAAAQASFALDAGSLEALKRKSREVGPEGQRQAVRQAAAQFEAVFMNMLMKSMRESLPKDGLFESDAAQSYTGMLDAQMAQKLSSRGMGLADMIVKQLEKRTVDPASLPSMPRREVSSTLDRLRQATAAAGAMGTTGEAPAPGAAAREFVRARWDDAQAAAQATGMPAQFILGQAALESGWGRREIRHADGQTSHNLFGIKATGAWKGPTVEAVTTEYVGGVARRVTEKFRAYGSYAESFADYARLIANNPRYAATLRSGDAAQFAASLQNAGYATDPRYAQKLTAVIAQTLRAVA
ncbi:MAG: flagellar assembly peptidoglycan hydrolase FlgJ [Burkholderiales bacterium]|nr:flagellar assembly peptidoglycan hydrolase FlgJ [Burkholderiales bacterium]